MNRLEAALARLGLDGPAGLGEVRVVTVDAGGDGRAEADRLVDAGVDLVVLRADPPSGPAGLAAVALLRDLEPVAAVGTAGGPGWAATVVAVRDGLRRARPLRADPAAVADALGDPLLARATGLLARLSERRTAVLLADSATLAAAALLARDSRPAPLLVPDALGWPGEPDPSAPDPSAPPAPLPPARPEPRWLVAGPPAEPGGRTALDALGLEPLLDLGLGGDAARYALALLREAAGG